jgi:outer membrane biogenesis lipoprotein LolB
MRFDVVAKHLGKTVAVVQGQREIPKGTLKVNKISAKDIVKAEQFLEKLTGLRIHINTMA